MHPCISKQLIESNVFKQKSCSTAYTTIEKLSCYDRRADLSVVIHMHFDCYFRISFIRNEKSGKWFGKQKLPVLVEATTAFFGQMLCPDIDESTTTERSFDVANGTNNNDWWSFNDGHSFDNFFLVDLYLIETKDKYLKFFRIQLNVLWIFKKCSQLEIGQTALAYSSLMISYLTINYILKGIHHTMIRKRSIKIKIQSNQLRSLTWTWTISFTNDVRHTGFVAEESGQMDWLGWIILWESLDLSTVSSCPLFWVESHWTMARCRKFTMRLHKGDTKKMQLDFGFLWGYVQLVACNCLFISTKITNIFKFLFWKFPEKVLNL